jgi:hypothetical protein
MTFAAAPSLEPVVAPRTRISWVELCCLNCGEVAGYIEDGRLVKPVIPGRIRMHGRRLRCGRCDGLLLSGERGMASSVEAIG